MANVSRRRDLLLAASSMSAGLLLTGNQSTGADPESGSKGDTTSSAIPTPQLALNTSTLRGHKLSVPDQIQVASEVGYDGIEPWIRDLRGFVENGGDLKDLRNQLKDSGLQLVGAIGFAKWIVDDDTQRQAGLDEARRDMEMVRVLGGKQIAAPPIGAHQSKTLGDAGPPSLETTASRYRDLLEVGKEMGVTPLLELWGFSPTLSKLAELAYVATASAHPMAAVLPDFYHIYKGGNEMTSLEMIEASRMPLFHINDYPATPPISEIADKDRVYPGDGVCPLVETIAMLLQHGFDGTFSLELFNPGYWEQPATTVAEEGHDKSRAVIEKAVVLAQANDTTTR